MVPHFFQILCNFARSSKKSCIQALLILQVAALTPMPRLSAETTTITVEVQKPMDELWSNFDSSYEALLNLVARLEKTADTEDIDEEAIEELRKIVIRLAQFGSAEATPEEITALVDDIIGLFIDEEEINDLPSYFYNNLSNNLSNPRFHVDEEMRYLPCDFWKKAKQKTKHCAHKVAKFVRHHKKEILIGAAAAIVVGVAVYAIAGACAAETAAAASAATAGSSSEDKETSEQNTDDVSAQTPEVQSPEAKILEQLVPLKEALAAEESSNNVLSSQDSVVNKELDYAKRMGAKIAHELWSEIGKTGALAIEAEEEIKNAAGLLIPDEILENLRQEGALLVSSAHTKENWQKKIDEVHQKIDQWFDQPIPYDKELQKYLEERFVTGDLPFPVGSNLLRDLKKISEVSNAIRSGSAGATIAKEITIVNRSQTALEKANALERQVGGVVGKAAAHESVGVRIRMDGVWEIKGKNIKTFDMNKIDDKKMQHFFDKKRHQLDQFTCSTKALVDQVTRSIIEADRAGKIPINKDFAIRLQVEKLEIEVRGIVLDGELRYGTFFIPDGK